jgi:type IV pilus assembly protein PilM
MGILEKDNDYFGLDLGTTGVRLVQLQRHAGNPALVTYGDMALPFNIALSDSPVDQDKAAGMIAELARQARVTTPYVVAGIPSSQAFATVITTPRLNEAELAKSMKLQADQYIPMAPADAKVDWQIIGPKGENEMLVLLVAAPNSVVEKYLKIIEKAGLKLLALELNAIAVARSLMPPRSDLATVVIDIGCLASEISLLFQGAPHLVRSVNVGGNTFVKSVAQSLGLDDVQAEQFTQKFGLTQTKLEGQVLKAVKGSLDNLTGELDKSIKFFVGQNPGVKIEKLILTGGTAALPELPTYLANATGYPVEMGNPWTNVSYPAVLQDKLSAIALHYGVAVGLSQRDYL